MFVHEIMSLQEADRVDIKKNPRFMVPFLFGMLYAFPDIKQSRAITRSWCYIQPVFYGNVMDGIQEQIDAVKSACDKMAQAFFLGGSSCPGQTSGGFWNRNHHRAQDGLSRMRQRLSVRLRDA